jgi:uncharacterized membrane protein
VEPGACPRGLRRLGLAIALFLAAFVATAPWTIAGKAVGRLSVPIAVSLLALAGGLACRRPWRTWALDALRNGEFRLGRRGLLLAGLIVAGFVGRVTVAKFDALEVNAWDFSLYFDRPVEATLHGALLHSDFLGTSALADNASFLMLGFVPLYAIRATPLWLVLAPAAAIAGAMTAAFLLFRAMFRDDAAALILAAAFVFHGATARAAQYVFHVEIFYPLAIFLALWAWRRERAAVFAAAILLVLSIKEDAILPVTAFAAGALLTGNRRAWIVAAWIAALAAFAVDYFVVLPRFSVSRSAVPWFAWYWAPYGATPLRAVAGIVGHPLRAAGDAARSGIIKLIEPLLLLPVVGAEWFLAATAVFLPYAVARHAKLARFSLYYAMPVVPFLFVAAASGVIRIARPFGPRERLIRRFVVMALLAACALDGSGYVFPKARPEGREIAPLLASVRGPVPILVQGALLPHAGYDRSLAALDRGAERPDGRRGFLVDPAADPFPFRDAEIAALDRTLSADGRYERRASPHGLHLFLPRPADAAER